MKIHIVFASVLFAASPCWAKKDTHLRGLQAATYKPGTFTAGNVIEDTARGTKLFLSDGLTGRAIAYNGAPLLSTADGTQLAPAYHAAADGGAAMPKSDGSGYYYLSNSEAGDYPADFDPSQPRSMYAANLTGGVWSLEFDANNDLIGYEKVLEHTAHNCAGGVTTWGSWVSCEEARQWGQCWQVDPSGEIPAKVTDVTGTFNTPDFGNWEAFVWDGEHGYTTNDDQPEEGMPATRGAIVRYTPDATAKACLSASTDAGKWCALESGTHDWLKVNTADMTFEWVADIAQANPSDYGGSEGAHVEDGILTFATIFSKELFRLNLDDMTYIKKPVPFAFEPDNLRIMAGTVYLCTDGDENAGDAIWGWDQTGAYRVFYEEGHNYPAGVDFSPDKKTMLFSMWGNATYQLWRDDGLAFDDATAGTNYEVMGGIDA